MDTLYRFCVGYLAKDSMSNKELLESCSRIFLIDGQPIDFPQIVRQLERLDSLSDSALFDRKNALGDDSIHFQQMRAYTVSKQLLEHWEQLLGPDDLPQVAIVGSGFSGLTSALTILKLGEGRIKVTLFEDHHDLLPRFLGARGRRVHPYHHLRYPNDTMWPDLNARGSATWPCPIYGWDRYESGGIPDVLEWQPGSIEDIMTEVRARIAAEIAKFVDTDQLVIRTQTTVLDIQPYARDSRMMTIRERNLKKGRLDVDSSVALDTIFAQEPLEVFDAVIVAPGGGRDIVTMEGQYAREYWNPLNVENLAPSPGQYQFAIIGSGNSAASEVFNYLVPRRDFLQIHRQILKWRENGDQLIERLLDIDYSQPIALDDYRAVLTDSDWKALKARCFADLVEKDLLYSDARVLVSVFVRNLGNVFLKMNPINKFLVLFLYGTGFVTVSDLYEKYQIDLTTRKQSPQDYEIVTTIGGQKLLFCKTNQVNPPSGEIWRHISNSSGTARKYFEAFSTESGDIRGERSQSSFNVIREGNRELKISSFQELLLDKLNHLGLK